MAGVAALVSAGVGAYGALSSSPTANNVNVPAPFRPYGLESASYNAYQGIGGLPGQDVPGSVVPQFQQTGQNLYNNPYAQMFQQGANYAAPMGQQAAQGAYGLGQQLQGAGTSLIPYASNIMQTAFDPQNELYARLQQQTTDQARAGQAARGVATTPYGASLENDAMRKFNIDWQNAQLGRQTAGAGAAGSLVGRGAEVASGGSQMQLTAPAQYSAASMMPYATYGQIGQGQFGALNSQVGGVNSAQQLALNPVQAYLSYLGMGNQANQVGNQSAQVGLNQAKMGFDQSQMLGSQFGGSIAGLGNAYGKGFPGVQSGWNWLNSTGGGSGYQGGTPGYAG